MNLKFLPYILLEILSNNGVLLRTFSLLRYLLIIGFILNKPLYTLNNPKIFYISKKDLTLFIEDKILSLLLIILFYYEVSLFPCYY